MKRLFIFLASCLPIYLFAQGFGSFSHDQPYFAKDRVSYTGPLPTGTMYLWINPVASNVFKSQFVTNNVTDASGDRIGAVRDSSTNAYTFTNNINDSQNIIRWYTNRHGNTNPVIFVNASVGNAMLHCNNVFVTNSTSLSFWMFTAYYNDTTTGYDYYPNYPWSSYAGGGGLVAIPRLGNSGGIQQSTFQGQGGNPTIFGWKNNSWQLLSIYVHQSSGNNIILIRTNGVFQTATTNQTTGVALTGLTLGGLADGSSSCGDIAEVIGYGGELTSNEVYQIETYLRRHPVEYFGP